jgi:dTDP-4-dehydrorhamnose reductase
MTVWLTGAAGMLGHDVYQALQASGHRVYTTDMDVDIADTAAVDRFLAGHQDVQTIVNCAAWTNVDAAESHETEAFRVNATGPQTLAGAAKARDLWLIHISTDYVFDGSQEQPYTPQDEPDPASAYGRTKLAGERMIEKAGCNATVIRTAWLYGAAGKNFVATMLRLFGERDVVSVVNDQFGCPTYTRDLAELIRAVVEHPVAGVFHYTGSGRTTWFDFAKEIYRQATGGGYLSSACSVEPISSEEFAAAAPRPANSQLDCSRTVEVFGVEPVPWQRALEQYLSEVFRDKT